MTYNPEIHNRKSIRLKNYDYSKNGMYFVTICTYQRNPILCKIYNNANVGAGCHPCPKTKKQNNLKKQNDIIIQLSPIGKFIENEIKHQNIEKYIIMPDHIHCIINNYNQGRDGTLPLHRIVGKIKSYTTKKYNEINNTNGLKLWQRNYYEHIIKNEKEYYNICEYIKQNPQKWIENKM